MSDKTTPTAAAIAKVRRSGATWTATRKQLGVKWGSAKFTAVLNEAGFNAGGSKIDGSGPATKARYRRGAAVTTSEAK